MAKRQLIACYKKEVKEKKNIIIPSTDLKRYYTDYIINVAINIVPSVESPLWSYMHDKKRSIILFFTIDQEDGLAYQKKSYTTSILEVVPKEIKDDIEFQNRKIYVNWLRKLSSSDIEKLEFIADEKLEEGFIGHDNIIDIFLSGLFLYNLKSYLRLFELNPKDFYRKQLELRERKEKFKEALDIFRAIKDNI